MGIILKPKPGNKPLSAEQIVDRVGNAGIAARADRARAQRGIIEQILLQYSEDIEDSTEAIDFKPYEPWFKRWPSACQIVINDPSLYEEDELFYTDSRIWIGQCFPTDGDPLSILVMRIAKLIDYDAVGE